MKFSNKKWLTLIIFFSLISLLIISLIGPVMSNVEQPPYEILAKKERIEFRQYQPMIIAKVVVSGTRENALGNGFRLVADYIFGNNLAEQKIAMTAPVEQQSIAQIKKSSAVQQKIKDDEWQINFVMPAQYNLKSLPKPKNQKVSLSKIPAKKYAALRFSGSNSSSNIAKHEKQLLAYLAEHNIAYQPPVKYAFYNPPWTLPFLRRNEVMVEIQ